MQNAKQVLLIECMDMLDKVSSNITGEIFGCTEGHKAIMKSMYELDTIQLEITALAKSVEIAVQQKESYEKAEIVSQSWLQEQT